LGASPIYNHKSEKRVRAHVKGLILGLTLNERSLGRALNVPAVLTAQQLADRDLTGPAPALCKVHIAMVTEP